MIEEVHPTAVVDPKATLGEGVRIGAFTVVGPEEKIEIRGVTTGPSWGTLRVVTKGVAAGERVVVEGFQKVRPGMVVAVAAAATPDVATPPPGSSEKN